MTMDISDFYLNLLLPQPEYIQIKISDIPEEIINEYHLREKATKTGHVYIEARKGMYGLPQAGLIANKLLKKTTQQTWVQAKQNSTGTMEAQHPTNSVHIGSG